MAGELFKMMAGVDMVHVPYRGESRSVACVENQWIVSELA
jgi:tripartite-type tricarboxylate transporter receptor subunit TctC